MVKRRVVVLSVLAVVALLVVAVREVMSPREPVYLGEPLHYWLSGYVGPAFNNSSTELKPTVAEAEEAVNAIGTNAIPALLQLLRERDSPLKLRVYKIVRRQRVIKMQDPSAVQAGKKAMAAFSVLGVRASNAMPELAAIYDLNPNPLSRQLIVVIAPRIAPQDEETVPLLLRALSDTNDVVLRHDAAIALGTLHTKPDTVVPALMKSLDDPHPFVQQGAIEALDQFGEAARPAIPALRQFVHIAGVKKRPSIVHSGYAFGTVAPSNNFYVNLTEAAIKTLEDIEPK
jgi:hypothetical protein